MKYQGKELIERLCSLFGPSGCEFAVAEFISSQCSDVCDTIKTDRLGNLIATISCGKENATRLMVSAHMDEVGFMVNEITDDGYLKLDTVGGIEDKIISGKRVLIGDENSQIKGVISSLAIHHKKREDRANVTPLSAMYVDIGATSKEEATKYADIGTYATFDSEFYSFGADENKLKGKAIDDRMGCAVMIEAMRRLYPVKETLSCDIYFSFTVREEIGISGARVAAQTITPDFAIVLETTAIADIADVAERSRVAIQGNGGAISLMDRSTIYDKEFINSALDLAKKKDIPVQVKKYVSGGNDAAHIHKSGVGVRTLALSVPTRYLHSPACVADIRDYRSTLDLVTEMAMSDIFDKMKGAKNV